MHILDYLEKIPETEEGKIVHYLHNLISSYPGIITKVHFNSPFYTKNRWVCYLGIKKTGGVELGFVMANQFSKHLVPPWMTLDFKKRKQVAGITYYKVEDIDVEIIDLLMQEALLVDDRMKPKKRDSKLKA